MKKVISYSLYNGRKKDVLNAIVNCFLAKKVYPDWICRFYVDHTTTPEVVECLKTFDHVEVIEMPDRPDLAGKSSQFGPPDSWKMFWRFLTASDPDVDIMISRDSDSLLSERERVCVEEWLNSDKGFHIIRDHCYHGQKIMGGIWGSKKGTIENINDLLEKHLAETGIYDQGFLAEKIYPKVLGENNLLVHYNKDQKLMGGIPSNGYHNDGGIHMPGYNHIDQLIEGISLNEYNNSNLFHCIHCGRYHDFFIGGIMDNIPDQTMNLLKGYFEEKNITFPF